MNMTTPNISPVKKDLLDEYGLGPNTREYYELLVMAIKEVCVWWVGVKRVVWSWGQWGGGVEWVMESSL